MHRLPGWILLAAAVAALAGCGGDEPAGSSDDTLAYFPADSALVLVVSTDLESEQWEVFERRVAREAIGASLEDGLRELAADLGVSYEDDIEPLLGNELVAGTQSPDGLFGEGDPGITLALQTTDGEQLRNLLGRVSELEPGEEVAGRDTHRFAGTEILLAADGDVLLAAENDATLERAFANRDGDEHLTEETFATALDGLSEDALIRAYGGLDWLFGLDETARLRQVPWFDALTTFGIAASFDEEEATLEAVLNTDGRDLSEDELPLATDAETPEIVSRPNELSGANANQSVTTVFLLRTAEIVFPESRFVRRVQELEAELGIDFEEEILRQFDGPSVSVLGPDGQTFAARSEVRDPETLREQLRVLAPHLPELVEGLEGLTSQGLAALLLFAPDAPALPMALQGVEVEEPAGEDGLYRVSGLTGDGPAELYFGLVGEVFVVASDEARALEIAEAETEAVEDAQGAAVSRLELEGSLDELEGRFGAVPPGLREVVGSAEASTDELRATLLIRWR